MSSARGQQTTRTGRRLPPPVNRVVVEKGKSAGKTAVPRAARPVGIAIVLNNRDREALAIGRDFLDQRERDNLAAISETSIGAARPRAASGGGIKMEAPASTPLLDRILGELGGVYERVNTERKRVEEIADAAMGSLPESDSANSGRSVSEGKVHEAIERVHDVHQAITALRNQIDRLVPL